MLSEVVDKHEICILLIVSDLYLYVESSRRYFAEVQDHIILTRNSASIIISLANAIMCF